MEPPVLEVENLHRAFGKREILQGVSFSVRPGEIYALLGPNGAGKTTTLRIVLGLLEAHRGNVSIAGRSLTRHRPRLLRKVGFMLEQPRMIPELSLEQNLHFFASIYRVSRSRERIEAIIDELGLSAWRDVSLSRYSKGMGQKAALGRALLHDPSVLILDEPLAGLDPVFQEEFRGKIQRLRSEGKTLLLSSHDLNEVERLCTHLGMLHHGRLIATGSIDAIRDSSGLRRHRFRWADPASAGRAAGALERRHHVRRDHTNPHVLVVILPEGVDPTQIVRGLPADCDPPIDMIPTPVTLEDIFLSRMRDETDRGMSAKE